MIFTDENAILWLNCCSNLPYRAQASLLRAVKRPKILFEAFETVVFSVIKEGEYDLSPVNTAQKRRESLEKLLSHLQKREYFFLTPLSEDYPESFGSLSDPPLVLFGKGNRELLKERKFCIVGSRNTPPFAQKAGEEISSTLSQRFAIVTGLAEGGDCAAIQGAKESGRLICVLPCGLDEVYPASHRSIKEEVAKKGLLLSEYAPNEKVKKYSFHQRNRLLASLCEGVLVLSAGSKSGTLITANKALEYGRDVFAFPYNVGLSQGVGCNELLKMGAYVCTDAQDIFSVYGILPAEKKRVELTDEERTVYELLRREGELHVALLADKVGVQVYQITATLSSLELKGLVVKAGGNRYSAL